jgi:hypothetical protein
MAAGVYWCLLTATISRWAGSVIPRKALNTELLGGTALTWTSTWKFVPEQPEISAYLQRWSTRPAVAKVKAIEAELVAAQNQMVS